MAVHPLAVKAVQAVGSAITNSLPAFIRDRYEIVVDLALADGWRDRHWTRIGVMDRVSGDLFPLERLAAGFQVWTQLAAYKVISAVADQEAALVYLEQRDDSDDPELYGGPLERLLIEFSGVIKAGDVPALDDGSGPVRELIERSFWRSLC